MPRGAWILLVALALAGIGAWGLLAFGAGSTLPGVGPSSGSSEEPEREPPDPTGPGRMRRPVPEPVKKPAPEGRAVELRASSPGWGPVAGANVQALGEAGLVLAEGVTGADGRAALALPADGLVHLLAADHPEFVPWRGPLPAAGPLEATLLRAGSIGGLVLGPDGRAAAGARIAVGEQGAAQAEARVGPDGIYTLTRLPPGAHSLTCSFQGQVRGFSAQVEAGRETRIDIDFAPTGPLVSGFLMGPAGEPKADWWVAAEAPEAGFRASGRVKPDGAFQLQLAGPARVDLLAGPADRPGGAWVHLASHQVSASGLAGLRLQLGGMDLRGRIALEEGGALPEKLQVRAWREHEGNLLPAGSTGSLGEDGSFEIAGLLPGAYRLEAGAPGLPTSLFWLGSLGIGPFDAGTLLLTRQGLGELRILCQGKGGPAPETFQLWRREGDAWLPLSLTPLGANAYLVPALPAGEQVLRVEAEGFVPGELEASIPAGAAFRLTLEFLRGHPVTLAIQTAEGRTLASLHGRLAPDGPVLEAKPAGPGLWTFPALPAGRITLLLSAPGFPPARLTLDVPARELPAATLLW